MKRLLIIFALSLTVAGHPLWAIPSTINYQGTLKEKGLPATGTKQMLFRITSQDGSTVYWSGTQVPVPVANGLFSAQLTPVLQSGYTWDAITPYMEVSVEGQLLLPREPINATVYATISGSVVDGAVTTNKIADGNVTRAKIDPVSFQSAGVGLVPVGAIMMFDTACPPGWTVYSALQGKFPVGADTTNFQLGTSGGSLTHSHTISTDGAHTHTTPQTCNDEKCSVGLGSNNAEYNPTSSGWVPQTPAMTTSTAGNHNHGGLTGPASSLPPYLPVLYCQKQ